MSNLRIDTGPLPAEAAEIVREVLEDLIGRHPGLAAFQLGGSYWRTSSQLPDADIDLRRFGEIDPSASDFRVAAPIVHFHHRGLLFEFAEWVFATLDEPDAFSLRDAVSVARSHVLWERGDYLRRRNAEATKRLLDPQWRSQKFDEGFDRAGTRFIEMRDTNHHLRSLRTPPTAITDDAYFKHVFYTLVDHLAGLVSALDFRPPSLARKALMEIADCLAAMKIPHMTERIYEALGIAGLTIDEMLAWRDELVRLYDASAAVNELDLPKRRYHTSGVAAMLDGDHWRAALFPLWRGLEECRRAVERTRNFALRDEIYRKLTELRARLDFDTEESITNRIEMSMAALSELHSHKDDLLRHLQGRIDGWSV